MMLNDDQAIFRYVLLSFHRMYQFLQKFFLCILFQCLHVFHDDNQYVHLNYHWL